MNAGILAMPAAVLAMLFGIETSFIDMNRYECTRLVETNVPSMSKKAARRCMLGSYGVTSQIMVGGMCSIVISGLGLVRSLARSIASCSVGAVSQPRMCAT